MSLLKMSPKRLCVLSRDPKLLEELAQKAGVELKLLDEASLEVNGDAGKVWAAEQVLKAIGLGFTPKQALKLLGDDYFLEVIDLKQVLGNPKRVAQYKARVIGKEGKAKKKLQEISGAAISVFDDDIAVLGTFEELQDAKAGIAKLLAGWKHESVYAFMEKRLMARG